MVLTAIALHTHRPFAQLYHERHRDLLDHKPDTPRYKYEIVQLAEDQNNVWD
jgi:hypothetical protein